MHSEIYIKQYVVSYLLELRNLAVNRRHLDVEITSRMKGSNVLLGTRRMKKDGGKALGEGNQDYWDLQDDLLQPSKVAIVDDTNAYRLFGDRIFCAPQEDILEGTLVEKFRFILYRSYVIRTISLSRFSTPELPSQ